MEELGVLKFLALTEQQPLEESEMIAVQGGAMSVNKVAVHEQKENIGAKTGIAANEVTSRKQATMRI